MRKKKPQNETDIQREKWRKRGRDESSMSIPSGTELLIGPPSIMDWSLKGSESAQKPKYIHWHFFQVIQRIFFSEGDSRERERSNTRARWRESRTEMDREQNTKKSQYLSDERASNYYNSTIAYFAVTGLLLGLQLTLRIRLGYSSITGHMHVLICVVCFKAQSNDQLELI